MECPAIFRSPPDFCRIIKNYDTTGKLISITCSECDRPSVMCACMGLYKLDVGSNHMCTDIACAANIMNVVKSLPVDVCDCWLIKPDRYKSKCFISECNEITDHQIDSYDFRCYPKDGPFNLKCLNLGHTLKTNARFGIKGPANKSIYANPGRKWLSINGYPMAWSAYDRFWYIQNDNGAWVRANWKYLLGG